MLSSDKKEILRAVWDFFVLFSGISTASNLTRTQGRQIRSSGLFLVRPPVDKKPPGPPPPPTDPAVSPDGPPSHPESALPTPAGGQDQLAAATVEERKKLKLPVTAAPVVLQFAWTGDDLLERQAAEPQVLTSRNSPRANSTTQLAPSQGLVELEI